MRRATLRGGFRFRGGTSSATAADAAASRTVADVRVRGRRGDASVVAEEKSKGEELGREGEKADVTAKVMARAAGRIFILRRRTLRLGLGVGG
mmetsp:Transcript_25386/g.61041  ORF Transcript_25386/g.61041 Transcript_25386/m.61041 type:complete len:93 (+) Transcript_25386:1832-2110(+)